MNIINIIWVNIMNYYGMWKAGIFILTIYIYKWIIFNIANVPLPEGKYQDHGIMLLISLIDRWFLCVSGVKRSDGWEKIRRWG